MKSVLLLHILSAIIFSLGVWAEQNVYKKNFDMTGKAYYFTPSQTYEGYKVAVGEDCTTVVVKLQDATGNLVSPSSQLTLSSASGYTYVAEAIKYPNGLCTLPDSQRYNKEVISSTPDELVSYYNGKSGPLTTYSFKTTDKQAGGLFSNKWVLIGIIGGAVALVLIIIVIIIFVRRNNSKDEYSARYSKRLSSHDGTANDYTSKFPNPMFNEPEMKKNAFGSTGDIYGSEPISSPNVLNTNWNSTPRSNYNNTPNLSNGPDVSFGYTKINDDKLLEVSAEPKRITSITYEEQQNYSNIMKKATGSSVRSRTQNIIPPEYEKYKTFKVIRKFTPQRDDELHVEIGQLLKMIKSFEDGWTLCYNIETEKEGYIPKNKLFQNDQMSMPQHSNSKNSQITSSTGASSVQSTKPLLKHNNSGNSQGSYYSNNSNTRRKPSNPNIRNGPRSGGDERSQYRSRSPNPMKSPRSPRSPNPNKYYRKPSNDNYSYNYSRN